MSMFEVVCASLYGGPILSDVVFRRQRYSESDVFSRRHLPNLMKGGLNFIFLPAANLKEIAVFYKELRDSNGKFTLVKSASEVKNAMNDGKFSCVLAASYSTIGADTSSLEMLYELGVRLFTMSGNRRNIYTDGCGERGVSGLSYLGIDLVGKLEDLGIIIDVSHTSDKGVEDIFDVTNKAVIVASHSNSRKICNNPRNLTDEQIKAIAERGGMVGTSTHPTLVSWEKPDVNDLANHIIYIENLVGSDYVGIGTDYVDYIEDTFQYKIKEIDPSGEIYGQKLHTYPKDIETVAKISRIFESLEKRGISKEVINKIIGENVLSVFKKI